MSGFYKLLEGLVQRRRQAAATDDLGAATGDISSPKPRSCKMNTAASKLDIHLKVRGSSLMGGVILMVHRRT
jgi:hypothetical protein